MKQPISSSTFDRQPIPTGLSATQATQPNNDSNTTLSSMRLQAPFFSDDLFSAPLLLDAQTILESEFQSNSIVTHISRPAASYPSLNGLGFHYPAPSSFFKQEDFLDQEVVP